MMGCCLGTPFKSELLQPSVVVDMSSPRLAAGGLLSAPAHRPPDTQVLSSRLYHSPGVCHVTPFSPHPALTHSQLSYRILSCPLPPVHHSAILGLLPLPEKTLGELAPLPCLQMELQS